MWNLTSFCLETVLVSVQDRCIVCARCTIGLHIILDAHDGTPRSCGFCGISLLSIWRQCWCQCKIGAWFALDVPQAQKSVWTHSMVPLGDVAQVEARFGLSDLVLILTQDRSTVCVKRTIRSETILDASEWNC